MLEKDNELRQYLDIFWRYKWMIIGLFIVAVLTAGFVVFRLTPIYETSATIMIKEKDTMSNLFDSSTQMLSSLFGKNKVATYSRMIKTRNLMEKVIDKLDLRDDEGKPLPVLSLLNAISVNEIPDTDLIEISIEHKDPVLAQKIANTLVEEFSAYCQDINKAELSSARQFIEVQVNEVRSSLKDAEDKLLEYKKSTNTIAPSDEAKQAITTMTELEKLAAQAQVELKTSEASMNGLKEQLDQESQSVVSASVEADNPLINQMKGKLVDLETQLVGLKAKYTDQNPEIVTLSEQIQKVKDDLKKEVQKQVVSTTTSLNPIYQGLLQSLAVSQTEIISNRARVEAFDNLIVDYESSLKTLPQKELDLIRLERVATLNGEIYSMLMTKHEEIQISEAMQISNVVIIDPATAPLKPVKPNKKVVVAVAGILAAFLGIGLAFLLDYLDTTVKSTAEIEQLLGIPVLGNIPDVRKLKKRQ